MKKVFLHIGCHKSGSTALQFHLAVYDRLLRAFGFSYPRLGRSGIRSRNQDLATALRAPPEVGRRQLADYLDFMARSRATSFFLSAESLYRDGNAPRFFRPLADETDLTIVLVVRRPDTFHESFYRQLVRNRATALARPFPDFLARQGKGWRGFVDGWLAEYGRDRMVVVAMAEDGSFDSIAMIAGVVGLPVIDRLPRFPVRNPSLGCETIAFVQWLRANGIDFDGRRLARFDARLDHRSSAYFSLDERIAFVERFRAENEALGALFGFDPAPLTTVDVDAERQRAVFDPSAFEPERYLATAREVALVR
ncbi:MAG TPA: hypothetical protein PLJ34_00910 [Hyphomicrobiales bacterium]|nr:hypothetical protein [Hyphomicrobiales bacterium]